MSLSAASLNPRPPDSSPPSPSQSQQGPITIDTLISYLVAAKRSLSSIHHVHRATTVLAEARSAIESTAALVARTTYLRRSLQSQLKILRGIQYELEGSANAIQGEFQALIRELDAAGRRLEQTIDRLKTTRIEDGFKPPPPSATNVDVSTAKETLYDFVEESPASQIHSAMKEVIDSVQDNHEDTSRSIRTLEDDLQTINDLLTDNDKEPSTSISGASDDYIPPNLSHLLKTLEDYAHNMAQSLESLVKHFDLCATAIKHTEGAGASLIRKYKSNALPDGVDIDVQDLDGPAEPMNEAERTEMLAVLANDAAEVDDVVLEIAKHADDMDGHLNEILHWRERHERAHRDVATAFRHLESLGSTLATFVAASQAAATRWTEDKSRLNDGIAGMEELESTYTNFLHAYDRLIIEAARRRASKKQMERIIEDAQAKLNEMYESDLGHRQQFREELGDYLPSDIWEGLHLAPARFEVRRVDEVREGAEGWLSVPELERGVVEGAVRRVRDSEQRAG